MPQKKKHVSKRNSPERLWPSPAISTCWCSSNSDVLLLKQFLGNHAPSIVGLHRWSPLRTKREWTNEQEESVLAALTNYPIPLSLLYPFITWNRRISRTFMAWKVHSLAQARSSSWCFCRSSWLPYKHRCKPKKTTTQKTLTGELPASQVKAFSFDLIFSQLPGVRRGSYISSFFFGPQKSWKVVDFIWGGSFLTTLWKAANLAFFKAKDLISRYQWLNLNLSQVA